MLNIIIYIFICMVAAPHLEECRHRGNERCILYDIMIIIIIIIQFICIAPESIVLLSVASHKCTMITVPTSYSCLI